MKLGQERGLSLTGPDGLLTQFTKNVLETALQEEMTEHRGHQRNQAASDREGGNVHNGSRSKTVLTENVLGRWRLRCLVIVMGVSSRRSSAHVNAA